MKLSSCLLLLACAALVFPACATKESPSELPAVSAPVPPPQPVYYEVTASKLNLRRTPSTDGAVVGTLDQGARIAAPYGQSRGWYYVVSDSGETGYVFGEHIAPAGQPEDGFDVQ